MKRLISIMVVSAFCIVMLGAVVTAREIDTDLTVSLNFDNTPISSILKMLAAQNNLNLVVSSAVEGKISISLDEVSLTSALDAILIPNGYNYHISDDIIIVKDINHDLAGELISKTYRLNYLDAAAAVVAIEPLLSSKGKALILAPPESSSSPEESKRQSRLMVHDYPGSQVVIGEFLKEIDLPKKQVSVEVKIIETNLTDEEKLGINWPKSVSASINGAPSPGVTSSDIYNAETEAAVMPLEDGNWQLGYLTVHQMDIVINFLKQRNHSKLLSNPRLTTMDGETATIQVQKVIPIQTINRFSEGAIVQDIVTYQDEEIGISLKVTPHINDDSAITMEVNPVVEEIIGFTGPIENQRPITSERSVNTVVTVKDNETIVLGGLLKESQIEVEEKVPLLGYIPILGALFTNRSTEVETTDLLILITPSIVN